MGPEAGNSDRRIRLRREGREPGGRISPVGALAAALFVLLAVSLVLVVPYRQWGFTPAWVLSTVRTRFLRLYRFLLGRDAAFGITVYQYLAVALAGAALAACGTVLQGGLRSPLAGPSTMGVMAGGSLGCLAYLWLLVPASLEEASGGAWLGLARQGCILAGCLLGTAAVLLTALAAGRGRLSPGAMLLSGTVLSSTVTNLIMLAQYYMVLRDPADPRIQALQTLLMGSFNAITSFRVLVLMAAPVLVCLGALLALRGRLDLLTLSEEESAAMGLSPRRLRWAVVLLSTVLTSVVVAFCGRLGFLGFMVPLAGRKLVGPQMRTLLPASMLLGALLLTAVYDVAAVAGLTDYLNLFTSGIGGGALVFVLLRGRRGRR